MGGAAAARAAGWALRPDWGRARVGVMEAVLRACFKQNPAQRATLRATGARTLVHAGFRIDDYWGAKRGRASDAAFDAHLQVAGTLALSDTARLLLHARAAHS